MFYLHSLEKDTKKKIIILGFKTYKTIHTDKDKYWDGTYEIETAKNMISALESLPDEKKFWEGPISIVEKE